VPTLWRYLQTTGDSGKTRLSWLTALVGAGYFSAWSLFGIVVFPFGAALAEIEMQQPTLARVVPMAVGVVVVLAGTLQFSVWKAHHLACCPSRSYTSIGWPANASTAWRQGLRLSFQCTSGCAGFTAILLVLGVMDLRVMALVTAAITAERLVVVGVGLLLVAGAAGLG
jgi:predicted metal-binding membrane protein